VPRRPQAGRGSRSARLLTAPNSAAEILTPEKAQDPCAAGQVAYGLQNQGNGWRSLGGRELGKGDLLLGDIEQLGEMEEAVALAEEPDQLSVFDHWQAADLLVDHDTHRRTE
jgi:hypothetical protein